MSELPMNVRAAINAAMDALTMGDTQDEAWQEAVRAYEAAQPLSGDPYIATVQVAMRRNRS